MYLVKPYIEPTGKRNAVLLNAETGIPLWWPTLYVSGYLRSRQLALKTITKNLEAIKILLIWADARGINLEERISSGEGFENFEIDSLISLYRLQSNEIDKYLGEARSLEGVIDLRTKRRKSLWDTIDSIPRQIGAKSFNVKLSYCAKYINWLANRLADSPYRSRGTSRKDIEAIGTSVSEKMSSLKLTEHSGSFSSDRALSNSQVRRVLDVIRTDSPENPFQNSASKVRNLAIIMVLLDTGIRSAELKNLRLTDVIQETKSKVGGLLIKRRVGSKRDSRIHQPNPKTIHSERAVPLSPQAMWALNNYVANYRNEISNAEATPYIFLSHSNDPRYRGKPISSINTITDSIREITGIDLEPHALRHTATWKYCLQQKKMGKEWDDFVEQLVLKFGWKNKESDVIRLYAKKYIREELFARQIDQQDEISSYLTSMIDEMSKG